MLAVERECFNKKCELCNKCVNNNYIVSIDGIKTKYFHHVCYRSFFELFFSDL